MNFKNGQYKESAQNSFPWRVVCHLKELTRVLTMQRRDLRMKKNLHLSLQTKTLTWVQRKNPYAFFSLFAYIHFSPMRCRYLFLRGDLFLLTLIITYGPSAQQELLPLAIALEVLENASFSFHSISIYIEEPEAHLFPEAQRQTSYKIAKVLNKLVNQQGSRLDVRVFLSTHSPYVMSAFNNLLQAGKIANESQEKKNKWNHSRGQLSSTGNCPGVFSWWRINIDFRWWRINRYRSIGIRFDKYTQWLPENNKSLIVKKPETGKSKVDHKKNSFKSSEWYGNAPR